MTSTSGLYEYYAEPALINIQLLQADFEWIVGEEHVRTQPYSVVIKAKDDEYGLGYANFALVRYRVNGGPTSTHDLQQAPALLLYPNPTHDWLRGDLSASCLGEVIAYQVFSYDGKRMLAGKLSGNSDLIEVGAMPTGAYLLHYEIGGQRWQQRFVVQ